MYNLNESRMEGTCKIFWTHFFALVLKRILYFKRDIRGLFCEIIIPCFVVAGGLSILLINYMIIGDNIVLTPEIYDNLPLDIIYSGSATEANMHSIMN